MWRDGPYQLTCFYPIDRPVQVPRCNCRTRQQNGESWPASDLAVAKSMTGTKTSDIKWSAIRQSQRHSCRTDGWVFLIAMRSKQARSKCSNSATGVDTNAVLRHDTQNGNDTKRAANGAPGHDERGPRVPEPRRQALGRWERSPLAHLFGRGTAMTGSLDRSPLAGRPTPQVQLRECHCVVPIVPRRYPRRKSVRPHQTSRSGRAKRLPQGTQKRAQL